MGGGRCEVSVIPYPLIVFESIYSHVYGFKWSPWSVPLFKGGGRVIKYHLSLIFSELNSI